jgi:glycosyltransferase involved in cell wall biosynthesis
MKPVLSYIIATRNRLPFLKITLERLIAGLQPDEEIVVVDGDSTDGSKEYLTQLFSSGKIHQFISEPDKNQAHGWNKALLMAQGQVIKKIIDDDVFCYSAIRKCRDFMLQNPDVDVVISNDLTASLNNPTDIQKQSRHPQFKKWKDGLTPSFTFGDVHMLICKSALSYIGLYNTSFVMMDWEYALRISYLKANIAYYTGYNALSVNHPQTVSSLKDSGLIEEQGKRGAFFYNYEGDAAEISAWSKIKISAGYLLKRSHQKPEDQAESTPEDLLQVYDSFYQYLSALNSSTEFSFD